MLKLETLASAGGTKHDGDKIRMDLIAPSFLEATASVLTFGARKYSARNWERGIAYGRVFGALMRHLWAWWRGERADPETGYSHLWHAACCLMFLIEFEQRVAEGALPASLDDRPAPRRPVPAPCACGPVCEATPGAYCVTEQRVNT